MTEINEQHLESILNEKGYDVSKITSLKIEPAVADGENYISKIYRVTVQALSNNGKNTKQLSLILKKRIKMQFSNQELTNKVKEVFYKEYRIYVEVLNRIQKFLPDNKQLWANCLAFVDGEEIYFEDLKESGYSISDRLNGLDISHSQIFIENLAKFHAASYIAIQNGEIDPTPYRKYPLLGTPTVENQIISNEVEIMVDVIKNEWGPEWSNLADRLAKYQGNVLYDDVLKLKFDESRINVLCHGDTWVNNFMFKYDADNRPISLKFVDFQISHYNTFAFDICYFLHTSVHWKLKKDGLENLLQIYCESFAKILEHNGLSDPRPTPGMIRDEMERLVLWSLMISLRNRPIIMAPSEQALKLPELIQEQSVNSKKRLLYTNTNYTDVMKLDLPYLLDTIDSVNNHL